MTLRVLTEKPRRMELASSEMEKIERSKFGRKSGSVWGMLSLRHMLDI